MGWTGTNVPRGTAGEYFKSLFTCENDRMKMEVVRAAFHGMFEHYAAVRLINKETGTSYVFGVATKIQWSRGYHNCTYKEMDESMGPYMYNCPESILKELTPTEEMVKLSDSRSLHGKKWRVACWENVMAKKDGKKVKDGDIVKFDRELMFRGGYKGDTFVAKKSGRVVKLYAYNGLNMAYSPYQYFKVRGRDWNNVRVIGNVQLNSLRTLELA